MYIIELLWEYLHMYTFVFAHFNVSNHELYFSVR